MMRSFFKAAVAVAAICMPLIGHADVGSKVNSWFNDMNYSTGTDPGVYKGQSARYGTLGSYSHRNPITQPFKLVNIQTPKVSVGCGGIDLYAGGFSAIDAEKFVDNLRSIGQASKSLAFMLAIQIVSPQLSGQIARIQTWADSFLNKDITSCEAATQLVGGTMEFFGVDNANCILNRMKSKGEDFHKASYACRTGGNRRDPGVTENIADVIRGNLAWHILMQDPFFQADLGFAEVVMNITGTLLIQDTPGDSDSGFDIKPIVPAIADNNVKQRFENIYNALFRGKEAGQSMKLFRCIGMTSNPNSCVNVTDDLQDINPNWDGMYAKVKELLKSIAVKIENDAALDAAEIGVISSTKIPIYRYLSAATAYFPRGTDVGQMTDDYAALIAHDILLRALEGIIERVEQYASTLKNGSSNSVNVKAYREDLKKVMEGLAKLRTKNEYSMEQLMAMQDRIATYERALMPRLGAELVSAAVWGK